jgi:hypothetical protein
MDAHKTTPWQWLRETRGQWYRELLLPVGAGIALAQFLTIALALHSDHRFLLFVVVASAGFVFLRTMALLVRLSQEDAAAKSCISRRDLQELFIPLLLSIALYTAIAPGARFVAFIALASLPHLALLAYLAGRYAAGALPALALPPLPTFESIGAPVLELGRALKTVAVRAWSVEKLPQIS